MKKITLAAAALAAFAIQGAYAGGVSPFYVGAGVGITNNNTDVDNLVADCRPDLLHKHNYKYADHPKFPVVLEDYCTKDDKDKSWNVYGGVNVSQNLAVEVGYVDLGKTADMYYSDPIAATQETTAVTLSAIGKVPLGKNSRTSVYGKAGVARWKSEATVSGHFGTPDNTDRYGNHVNFGEGANATKVKATGTSPVVGVGIEHDLTHNISLRAGWDRYYDVGKDQEIVGLKEDALTRSNPKDIRTVKTDVDVVSVGANYSFY